MNAEQEKLLDKLGSRFDLGSNRDQVLNSIYRPSETLDEILKTSYSSELGILKSIYYQEAPGFCKNLENRLKFMEKPILSIITSVFKGDRYIEEFMRNTTSQVGFEFYELILIDCNSPQNEFAVIKKYIEQFSNIKYIKLDEDPGLYEAWNIGIQESSGVYLSNANLDDRKSPAYYSILINELMDSDNEIISSLFWTSSKLPEEDIKDLPIVWYKDSNSNISYLDFFKLSDDSSKIVDRCVAGAFPIWKKSLHEHFGFFNENTYGPSSDYEFWLRASSHGSKSFFYKVPLGFYLKDPGSYARRVDVSLFNDTIINKYFYQFNSLEKVGNV